MTREERIKQLRYRIALGLTTGILLGSSVAVIGSTYCTLKAMDEIMAEPVPEETRYIWLTDETSSAVQEIAPVQPVTYDTLVQGEHISIVKKVADQYNFCPELIMAIIEMESGGDPNAVSTSGCIGLMQIKPKFAKERMEKLEVADLYDPYSNILVGVDILSELAEKYDDLPTVLMAYNRGEYSGAVEQAESGECSNYAKKIMARAEELEEQAGKKAY